MNLPFDWTIRSAVPEDGMAIAGILRDCWPDDTPDIQRITRLIESGQHLTQCAWRSASCVGFVDAFRTVSAAGICRWEVDLLAVHSSTRGRGVGRGLVAASVREASQGVSIARGLIRMGNRASEGAFAAAGFKAKDQSLTLFVAPPLTTLGSPERSFVVPVETLTYSGLWLESSPSPDALFAGRVQAAVMGMGQVGTLVSEDHRVLCADAGYGEIGNYRWWELQF
ncbi:MAG: GNAT family N-acetyltransferase [Anaerolineae bacterium]